MRRRSFLGVGTIGVIGLTGCLGNPIERTRERAGETVAEGILEGFSEDDDDGPGESVDVEETIATAVLELERATSAMGFDDEERDAPWEGFEESWVSEHTTTARKHLENARVTADTDQKATIDDLERLADVYDDLADALGAVAGAVTEVETAGVAVAAEDPESAHRAVGHAIEALTTANEAVDSSSARHSSIRGPVYEVVDDLPRDAIGRWIESVEKTISAITTIVEGVDDFLEGFERYHVAGERFEAESYDSAVEQYDEALVRFADAGEAFTTVESADEQTTLAEMAHRWNCNAGIFEDSSSHLVEAALAAEEGDTAGVERAIDDAEEAASRDC